MRVQAKKKLTKPKIAIIVVCSVILACIIAGLIFYFVQMGIANTLAKETERNYLVPLEQQTLENDSGSEYNTDDFTVDWEGLWAVNPNVCAWIRIPAIPDVSYPVIHYTDNDYYLRKSWRGDYLMSGCIMEDYHCSIDFNDFHTIVYGHNTVDTTMFGGLKQFQNQEFYDDSDKRIIIYTPEFTMEYKIFSVFVTDPKDYNVYLVGDFTRGEAFDLAEYLRDNSEIESDIWADGDDQILTLSTCSGTGSTKRLTVHAKKTNVKYTSGTNVSSNVIKEVSAVGN